MKSAIDFKIRGRFRSSINRSAMEHGFLSGNATLACAMSTGEATLPTSRGERASCC